MAHSKIANDDTHDHQLLLTFTAFDDFAEVLADGDGLF
jgi:hypothetical protein